MLSRLRRGWGLDGIGGGIRGKGVYVAKSVGSKRLGGGGFFMYGPMFTDGVRLRTVGGRGMVRVEYGVGG